MIVVASTLIMIDASKIKRIWYRKSVVLLLVILQITDYRLTMCIVPTSNADLISPLPPSSVYVNVNVLSRSQIHLLDPFNAKLGCGHRTAVCWLRKGNFKHFRAISPQTDIDTKWKNIKSLITSFRCIINFILI